MFVIPRAAWFALLSILPLSAAADEPVWEPDATGFSAKVAPFLKEHCLRCHGPDDQQAEFRVDEQLPNEFLGLESKQHWGEVVNVLNSHEMPPEDEPQPKPENVAEVVDWITQQMVRAELIRRDSTIVLRRLNRNEYRNTIRDLIGVNADVSGFPQDPPAGGFDNNGRALTVSPLLMELYLASARKILDEAIVEGAQPEALKWRIQPDSGDSDSNRVTYDGQRIIVNGGKNEVKDGFKVMHHESWDRNLNARDFQMPVEGEYIIRIRAGGIVPDRDAVVESARLALEKRMLDQIEKNPKGEKYHREAFERDLEHFRTAPMYDYGPPRLKLIKNLGGQPEVVAEFDVPDSVDEPGIYEVRTRFTTEKAGVTIQYAYSIPRELENFWMQSGDTFARPELWVDWFEIEGPVYDAWPPASHQEILISSETLNQNEVGYVREVLQRFMRRAYRRPVTEAEVQAKVDLFTAHRDPEETLEQAIKTPLIAVLCSPHFLYLSEPSAPQDRRELTQFELASRLSYFLWSSMPDESLLQLAEQGKLDSPEVIHQQVERMLADPKSEQFVKNFAGQWLGLREVGANPPAADLYPKYDRHLETSIVGESEAFFAEVLRSNESAMNLVKSDFAVVNERLARYYGIPNVRGDEFRRVPLPEGVPRGGVVTQASVLTITSNGTRTSPVKRGTWILKNILGTDPGLPVANAGDIAPKVPGIDKATVRQRLEIHRELPQCARCHSKIDPLGFSLENFNAAGEYRTQEGFGYKGRIGQNDPLIDASAVLPDGTDFVGVEGLQNALVEREELFLNCLAGKVFTYALGRELGIADQVQVQAAVKHMQEHDRTVSSLIQFVATSELFRNR
ncbi:MAG: DUF1592 domain-containing protein [Planctomycetaceae bacterium]